MIINLTFFLSRFLFKFFDRNLLSYFIIIKALPSFTSSFVIFAFGKKLSELLKLSNNLESQTGDMGNKEKIIYNIII